MENKQSFGSMIANLRRERGMTQAELAEQMGVTDKAVSKWERDLSMPDTASLPRLAEIFGITLDELMSVQPTVNTAEEKKSVEPKKMVRLILRCVALAQGVALTVTSFLGQVSLQSGLSMAGIGLACLALLTFLNEEGN